jgi:hypothetical protein
VSPVKYELGFYIPEDAILHSPCIVTSNLTYCTLLLINMVLELLLPSIKLHPILEWTHTSSRHTFCVILLEEQFQVALSMLRFGI